MHLSITWRNVIVPMGGLFDREINLKPQVIDSLPVCFVFLHDGATNDVIYWVVRLPPYPISPVTTEMYRSFMSWRQKCSFSPNSDDT